MAIIGAIQNGLWSSAATWPGGVFPNGDDDVFANTRTVYIDQDINVLSLNTTASGGGGSAGGLFYNTGSVSITALNILPGTTSVLTLTGNNDIFILSNRISGSYTTANAWGVTIPGATLAPNVSISSYVSGGSFAGVTGGILQNAGVVSVTGTIVGGAADAGCPGVLISHVGNYPVTFTSYGTVIGGNLRDTAAGIRITYLGTENNIKNSSVTVYGTVSGSPNRAVTNNRNTAAIFHSGTIPLYIYGDVIGGSGGLATGVVIGQSAIIMDGTSMAMISGNVFSGIANLSAGGFFAISLAGGSNRLDIIGDLINVETMSPIGCLAITSQTGTVNISGNILASQGARNTSQVMTVAGGVFCNIYGNLSGGRSDVVSFGGNTTLNVYGDVIGGFATNARGITMSSNSRGAINIYGTLIPGTGSLGHGIAYGSNINTSIFAKKIKGNDFGIGVTPGTVLQNFVIGPGINIVSAPMFNFVCEEMEFGRFGSPPVFQHVTFLDKTTNTITMPITSISSETKTLVDPNFSNIMPPASSVRLGTVYSGGNLVGACNVPTVEAVEFGVPVDDAVGIAALRSANIWNTSSTELTSLSTTIGYKLNNTATSETVGQLVAAFGA